VCFERYVGNKPLQKAAAGLFRDPGITLEQVYAMAERGQKKSIKFWDNVGAEVGFGLIGLVNILNPEAVVIGGGVARSFRFMAPAVKRTILRRAMRTQAGMVRILPAQLGDDAGIIGARVLFLDEKK
jgi:predicted NBD/HSP70 family sugar kinase